MNNSLAFISLKATSCLLHGKIFVGNLLSYSGRQATIKFLTDIISMVHFAYKCQEFLSFEILYDSQVTLIRVPGYRDIFENSIFDELVTEDMNLI